MFETAARCGNFTKAAEDLYVTQGAVSRQIRNLEDDLGTPLFVRDGPRVELTREGQQFYEAAKSSLAILRRAALEIRRLSARPTLTISVLPSFAAKWLVPRLGDFEKTFAEFELRIAASYDPTDFVSRPDIDIAIRLGQGPWDGLYNERLITESLFPVASPEFLKRYGPLDSARKIASSKLLYAIEGFDQWSEWFDAAGTSPPKVQRGARYGDAIVLQQAAIEGQGIALVRNLMSADDLVAGRLQRLSETSIPSQNSYYFVCPSGRQDQRYVAVFLDWIRQQASQSMQMQSNIGKQTRDSLQTAI